jgi:RNA polymerase sigma-70 factor (ECF subfamily)
VQAACRPSQSWNDLGDLRPVVVAYLGRYTRDDAEIEDVAQEAMLRAARFRIHLSGPERLRPWLLRIALNVLRDRLRRERRLPRADHDDEVFDSLEGREEIPGEPSGEMRMALSGQLVERCAVFEHLEAALAGLRASDRGVLAAWYGEDASRGRASRVCERAPRMAKVRVFRARRRLTRALIQRFLVDEEFDWPPGEAALPEPRTGRGARGARAAAVPTTESAPQGARRSGR